MSPAMTCAEAEPLLPLVADGAIDPDCDPALFAHLAACPTCQRAVATHDLIGLALRQPPAVHRPRHAAPLLLWPGLAAAAAGLALAATFYLRPTSTAHPTAHPLPTLSVAATPPVRSPSVAAPAPALPPEVIAVPRADGSTLYLVRQGEMWVAVDPTMLDGPHSAAGNATSGVQVRF